MRRKMGTPNMQMSLMEGVSQAPKYFKACCFPFYVCVNCVGRLKSEFITCRVMAGSTSEESDDLDLEHTQLALAADSPHPMFKLERCVDALSGALANHPTVPLGRRTEIEKRLQQGGLEDVAPEFPLFHCPFEGCGWCGMKQSEQEEHLLEEHQDETTQAAMVALGKPNLPASKQIFAVVNAAIGEKAAASPPLVCNSMDRRALRWFYEAAKDMECLICFICACNFPRIGGPGATSQIEWRRCQKQAIASPYFQDLFGLSQRETEEKLGVKTFIERFGSKLPNLAREPWKTELLDWQCAVPFAQGTVYVLCAPEDWRCKRKHAPKTLCPKCHVPICNTCWKFLKGKRQPQAALANDMWTGYVPKLLYQMEATYMEMLLASPYILSLICFVLEVEKEHVGNVLQLQAHMQRHRTGRTMHELYCFQ